MIYILNLECFTRIFNNFLILKKKIVLTLYYKCAKDENGSLPDGVEQAKKKPSGRVENI